MTLKGRNYICLTEDFGQDTGSFHAYVRSEKQFVAEHVRYTVKKGPAPTQGIEIHTLFRFKLCYELLNIWFPMNWDEDSMNLWQLSALQGAYSKLVSPFWTAMFPKHWDSQANALPFSKLTH